MICPPAVCEKAQRLERFLLRLEAGEPLEQVEAALGLRLAARRLRRLRARYEAGGRTWEALIDGRYGRPQTAHSALREWLYERKRADDSLTAPELARKVAAHFQVELSAGHINYLLRQQGLSGPPGHPYKRRESESAAAAPDTSAETSLDNAGLFFPRGCQAGDGGGGDGGELSADGR
jgi:transposase